jgi:hypothetical protein
LLALQDFPGMLYKKCPSNALPWKIKVDAHRYACKTEQQECLLTMIVTAVMVHHDI